jgi:hypothetical protein
MGNLGPITSVSQRLESMTDAVDPSVGLPPAQASWGMWLSAAAAALVCLSVAPVTAEPPTKPSNKQPSKRQPPGSGDAFEWKALPLAAYSPDTSLAGGAALLTMFDMPGERGHDSSLNLVGLYTLENQLAARLQFTFAFDDERWLLTGETKGGRWPDEYHGIGPHASSVGEGYDSTFFESEVTAQRRIPGTDALYAGLVHDFEVRDVVPAPGGRLAAQAPAGARGGRASGLGVQLALDRRDARYAARDGTFARLRLLYYTPLVGSQFEYLESSIDVRHYWALGGGHSIGLRGLLNLQSGRVPFFKLAHLGGTDMNRGISGDRFRDQSLASGQIEYRSPLLGRVSFATFASLGSVAHSADQLLETTPRWTVGGGVRYFIDDQKEMPLRLDLGFSADDPAPGVYFSIGEAF